MRFLYFLCTNWTEKATVLWYLSSGVRKKRAELSVLGKGLSLILTIWKFSCLITYQQFLMSFLPLSHQFQQHFIMLKWSDMHDE